MLCFGALCGVPCGAKSETRWSHSASNHVIQGIVLCMKTAVRAGNRALVNLRKGVAEFCVLALLKDHRAYGLELSRRLEDDGLIASASTLYPLLSRLSTAGLVDSEWGASDTGRPRKYYVLTELGAQTLDDFQGIWAPLRDAVDRTVKGGPE